MMRRSHKTFVLLAGLLALVGTAPRARAQSATSTAEALFQAGRALFDEGKTDEACKKLAEAQRLEPGGGTLLLLGICHEKQGKVASAEAELRSALVIARRDRRNDREKLAQRHLDAVAGRAPKVRVVVVSDEEVGSPEGRAVIERHAGGARAALVFESGRAGDEIVTDRKGTGAVRVTAAGVAAHAGNAHESGVNAIWALSAFVCEAQRLTDYAKGLTVNVGRIAGGRTKNTVPDEASCELDFRFVHPDEGVGLERALVAAALAAEARVPGSKVTVHGGVARAPLVRTRESEALATAYGAHAAAEGLGHALATRQGGGSDASTTSALGIASIDALGPRGKGFHPLDEQVELATLVPKAKALARFLAAAPRTH